MKSENQEIEIRKVKLIRKANDLVEGKYRFDIWEMRVFTQMLTMIYKDDEDFKEYKIYLKDMVEEFNIKDRNAYEWVVKGAEGLMKKEITIERETPEGIMEFKTYIAIGLDSFKNRADGKYISISFHPKMKPFLLQLQTQFLMYDIRNILSIQSSFSVRIYELLKQYEKIGKRRFSVQELKEMLDVSDKYPLYANFKQRVILKAQQDLEAYTDIYFTLQEIKRGKSITEVVFHIHPNKPRRNNLIDQSSKQEQENEPVQDLVTTEIYKHLKKFPNANISSVKDWLSKYSPEYIKQRIVFVENLGSSGKAIRNPIGLIQTMLLQPDLFDPIEEEKQKKVEQRAKKQQEQQQREVEKQKEAETKRIKKEYEQAKKQTIREIFESNPQLAKEFLQELRTIRASEKHEFIVDIAHDNYKTNIEGIEPNSTNEVLHNYELGGSFGAYLLDWIEKRFSEYQSMK